MEDQKQDWRELAIERNATPKSLRNPISERDFCNSFDVPESTYYRFLTLKETQEKILEICLNNARKRTPEVLEKLGEMAEQGDSSSIAMYLKFILELAEKTRTEINIGESDRQDLKEIIKLLKNETGNSTENSPELLQG
jgi:hypothetical protein